jgi:beta-glucosidase
MGYGLSYTPFNVTVATVGMAGVPMGGLNGTEMANTTLTLGVTVTNAGHLAGATPIIVTFAKNTRGVVRYIRMVAAFTKVYLEPGETKQLTIPVRISDLARYDPFLPWHDLLGNPVQGAYVVDTGNYTFYVGDCVDNGGITAYPVSRSTYTRCTPAAATAALGDLAHATKRPQLWGVYL